MSNPALVAELQAIAAEQRTGSLVIGLGSRKVRFGFEAGELVLLDLGEEKEVAMARKLLDYHKIGPEIHRHAVNTARATGASIIDTLRRQQLVAENEIDLVAQSMVEDLLALVFSLTHSDLSFTNEGAETYDLDKRAVRLRIDVDSLLAGVQARLDDEEAIKSEVGGFASVYTVADGAPVEDLDDFEQHLLKLIDGRKSIENLAVSFRDSDINMARAVAGLLRKGALTRVANRPVASPSSARTGDPSGVHRLNTGASSTAAAAVTGAPTPPSQFEVYRPAPARPSGNFGARLALGAVFAVVLAIGWMVISYGRAQGRINDSIAAIDRDISARNWSGARAGLAETEKAYGSDLVVKRRIDELHARLAAAIDADVQSVADAIAARDMSTAQRQLDLVPATDPRRAELARALETAKAAFRDQLAQREAAIRQHLDAGNVERAFALAEGEEEAMRTELLAFIDRWRLTAIEQASMSNQPMGRRQQLINVVQQARPTEAQMTRIASLQEELMRYQARRQEQLAQVAEQIASGAWVESQQAFDTQRLSDQAPGSQLEAEAKKVQARIAAVRAELEGLVPAVRNAVTEAVDMKTLAQAAQRLQAALTAYPNASNRKDLVSLAELINALTPVLGAQSTEEEIAGLEKLATTITDPAVARAIGERVVTVRNAQNEAAAAMERARQLLREARWDDAFAALERIGSARDWSRTPAGRQVAEVLAQAKLDREKHGALEVKFRAALTAGDASAAYALARELGRPYLPVLVESIPVGAEVVRDGKVIGKTPLILEISAAERVDTTLQVRMEGYTTADLKGADAVGGWRLAVDLERKPTATAAVGELITSQPGSDGTHVWLANSRIVARVAADGAVTSVGYGDNTSLERPVYATPVLVDGGVHLSTRDKFVLRIEGGTRAERLPVRVGSDFPPAVHRSQVILDRRFLILAGTDGRLVASDPRDAGAGWATAEGAAFAGEPMLIGERVLAARRDGTLIACQVDRGELQAQVTVGSEILAVWADAGALHGLTRRHAFRWTGTGEPVLSELPREAVAGNRGVLVTADRQVLIESQGQWLLVGSIAERANGTPLRWGDRAVIPEGSVLEVLGPGGFRLTTTAAFLNPVLVGERLAVATSDGQVLFYDPR